MNVTVWRIVKAKFAKSAFNGEGAKLVGGRWNTIGIPMVYTAENVSLATIEMRVPLLSNEMLKPYRLIRATIPQALIESVDSKALPLGWDADEPTARSKQFGSRWIRRGAYCVLRVPSAIVPHDFNSMLNPKHRDFPQIFIGKPERFTFHPRLWSFPE